MAGIADGVLILAALYLPGHFGAAFLVRKGDGLFELAMLRAAVSLAVAAPVLTGLALIGRFTVPLIVLCLAACAALFWLVRRRRPRDERHARANRWDLAGLAVVAGAFALFARPAEYVVNSRDPGVYTVLAAKLARTGGLSGRDPFAALLAPFHTFVEGKKYPGVFVVDGDLIVPQFFPAPFAFLGLGDLISGLWGSLYVVPVMGAVSVGMAYLLGREVFGRWAGLVGAALLGASYTQIWWARHPSSEVMCQLLTLAGLWLMVRFVRHDDLGAGVWAGVLIGGAMLVRVDGWLAAAAVPALFGYELLVRRPGWRWLYPGIPLVAFAGGALIYLNTFGARYLYIIYTEHGLRELIGAAGPLAVASLTALAAFLLVRWRWGTALGAWLEMRGRWLSLGCALLVAAAALWAYFILPVPWTELPASSREFDAYRPQILVRMVWYVTPVVAGLALAGLIVAGYRIDRPRALLIGAVLAFGFLYTLVPNVAPDLPWATRRFVPAVFPGVCLLAGYATVEAGKRLGRFSPRAGVGLSTALAALALAATVNVALLMPETREYEGAVAAFDRVERSMPEARVVYMEMPHGFDFTASTFEYLYGRPVLPYDRELFIEDVGDLRRVGLLEDAIYVTTDGGPPPLVSGLEFEFRGEERLTVPRLIPSETAVPTRTERWEMAYRFYGVSPED
jgi:hypothetical protein